MEHDREEECLEYLYKIWEGSPEQQLPDDEQNCDIDLDVVEELARKGLLKRERERIEFTREGRKKVEQIIRRHRLAERLLKDILDVDHERIETAACEYEHLVSEEITESICTLLGHPTVCIHGKPIPRGECCKNVDDDELQELATVKRGGLVKVVHYETLPIADRQKLCFVGIVKGSVIRVQQCSPAFILYNDECTVAIEREIAEKIFVKVIEKSIAEMSWIERIKTIFAAG